MFGLTNAEGNHGEDVKEYYFYLDATPTSSYLKYRYRYPLVEFPYDDLVATNRAREPPRAGVRAARHRRLRRRSLRRRRRRVRQERARRRARPHHAHQPQPRRGDGAPVAVAVVPQHVVDGPAEGRAARRRRRRRRGHRRRAPRPRRSSSCAARASRRCCSPRTRRTRERLWGVAERVAVREGRLPRVRGARAGRRRQPGPHRHQGGRALRARRPGRRRPRRAPPAVPRRRPRRSAAARSTACSRRASPRPTSSTRRSRRRRRRPTRRWSCARRWPGCCGASSSTASTSIAGSTSTTSTRFAQPDASDVRNRNWFHMINDDVISMPDTWEYPWYASWDLAFHTVALAMVDVDDAKDQLELMLRELYLHPSGQLPAYEWNFSDVNPPVHAWATLVVYETELEQRGAGDVAWLKSAFQKLLVNFTWWINRKDPTGRNVFEGGFLGLDNIGVFDRSAPLPTGGHLEQSDGTAWMAFFSQCMLGIALELSAARPGLRGHGAQVRRALRVHRRRDGPHRRQPGRAVGRGGRVLLRRAAPARRQRDTAQGALDGRAAAAVRHDDPAARGSASSATTCWRGCGAGSSRCRSCSPPSTTPACPGSTGGGCWPCSTRRKLRRILARMLDEDEFLSPHGLRALSRYHERASVLARRPRRRPTRSATCPAESDTGMFGGNSNWRGPVWFPVNYLILRAPAAPVRVLRRRLHGRVPDRLGTPVHAVRGGDRARPAAGVDLRPRRRRPPPGVRRDRSGSRPTRTGRTCCCSTSTSTATTAPASAPATRPDGPVSSPASSRCAATSARRICCRPRSAGTSCTERSAMT